MPGPAGSARNCIVFEQARCVCTYQTYCTLAFSLPRVIAQLNRAVRDILFLLGGAGLERLELALVLERGLDKWEVTLTVD